MKFLSPRYSLVLLVALVLSAGSVMAQDARRAKDGAAYRIDKESGFQIKDHVAELEVTVDDLKRQVLALENELREKQTVIDRLGRGESASGTLKEQTLAVASPARRASERAGESSCRSLIVPLNKRIEMLEEDLRFARAQDTTASRANVQELQSCTTARVALENQVSRLQTALMTAPSSESLKREQQRRTEQEQRLGRLKGTLASNQEKLATYDTKISSLEEQLEAEKKRLESELTKRQALEKQVATLQKQASESKQMLASSRQVVRDTPRAAISRTQSNQPKVAQAKARLSQQLTKIQRLIVQRKSILDRAKKQNTGVRVRIQPLKTKKNRSLDAIRLAVKNLNYAEREYQLSQELREIETVLESDIQVLRRIARI